MARSPGIAVGLAMIILCSYWIKGEISTGQKVNPGYLLAIACALTGICLLARRRK